MGTRRKAREAALQFLFQDDFCGRDAQDLTDLEERLELFCGLYQISRKAREYTALLLKTTLVNRDHIDDLIRHSATNWRLERIAYTDRNILRIAVCEMVYSQDVAHQVAINEAVEIAKRFGSDDSPPFVNGILDAVHKRLHLNDVFLNVLMWMNLLFSCFPITPEACKKIWSRPCIYHLAGYSKVNLRSKQRGVAKEL